MKGEEQHGIPGFGHHEPGADGEGSHSVMLECVTAVQCVEECDSF